MREDQGKPAYDLLHHGVGYFLSYLVYDDSDYLSAALMHMEVAAHYYCPKWHDWYAVGQYN